MSIWEFRQAMESVIPWWVPFVSAAVFLVVSFIISRNNRQKRKERVES